MQKPNSQITGIEEGEETHTQKDTETIFKKIIEENFPSLKKEMFSVLQEA